MVFAFKTCVSSISKTTKLQNWSRQIARPEKMQGPLTKTKAKTTKTKNMEGLLAKSQAKTWKNQQFARPFGKEKNQDLNNKNAGACWKTEAKHKQIQNNFDIFMLFSGKNKNNARKNKNIKDIKTYEKKQQQKPISSHPEPISLPDRVRHGWKYCFFCVFDMSF